MRFQLPKLDYATSEFGEFLSPESFTYHYGKHHQAYVDQTNQLIQSTPFESESLERIVMEAEDKLLEQAAQAWNHAFFWKCLAPSAQTPSRELQTAIESAFGSIERFNEEFVQKGVGRFGSGWVWLVEEEGSTKEKPKLAVVTTSNAENPMRNGRKPLLCCDLWEHAYYIDHRNERPAFLKGFTSHAAWTFASENFRNQEMPNMTRSMVLESGWEPLKRSKERDSGKANTSPSYGSPR